MPNARCAAQVHETTPTPPRIGIIKMATSTIYAKQRLLQLYYELSNEEGTPVKHRRIVMRRMARGYAAYKQRQSRKKTLIIILILRLLLPSLCSPERHVWAQPRYADTFTHIMHTLNLSSMCIFNRSRQWWSYVVMQTFSDHDWLTNFRMGKSMFQHLCMRLAPRIQRQTLDFGKQYKCITMWLSLFGV